MAEQQPESSGKVARDAAVAQLVSTGIYIALMVGVSVAITKRDAVARGLMWARRRLCSTCGKEAEQRAQAEFAREVSNLEHGGPWQ